MRIRKLQGFQSEVIANNKLKSLQTLLGSGRSRSCLSRRLDQLAPSCPGGVSEFHLMINSLAALTRLLRHHRAVHGPRPFAFASHRAFLFPFF